MATVTYFVALAFVRSDKGELVPGKAQETPTAATAEREAARMAMSVAGAVAFSRTGDPATGEFEDAVVLCQFGDVPTLDDIILRTS